MRDLRGLFFVFCGGGCVVWVFWFCFVVCFPPRFIWLLLFVSPFVVVVFFGFCFVFVLLLFFSSFSGAAKGNAYSGLWDFAGPYGCNRPTCSTHSIPPAVIYTMWQVRRAALEITTKPPKCFSPEESKNNKDHKEFEYGSENNGRWWCSAVGPRVCLEKYFIFSSLQQLAGWEQDL